MSIVRHQPGSKLLLAAAVVLALEVLAPTDARAACGDYVLIGGKSIRHSNSMPQVMHAMQPSRAGARCHCTGPTCSNGERQLPHLPPAVEVSLATDSGVISAGLPEAPAVRRFARFEDDSARPQSTSALIFHPPR